MGLLHLCNEVRMQTPLVFYVHYSLPDSAVPPARKAVHSCLGVAELQRTREDWVCGGRSCKLKGLMH